MHEHAQALPPIQLPSTLQGCRERLAALQDEIASIRIQIATTDIRRQTEKKSLDAAWFHRAKTALRLKQQEQAQLTAHMGKLNATQPVGSRENFKDALIAVMPTTWASRIKFAIDLMNPHIQSTSKLLQTFGP